MLEGQYIMMIIFEVVELAQNCLPNCPLTLFPLEISMRLHLWFVFLMMSGIMRNHGYHVSHFLGVIFNNLRMDSAYFIAFGVYSLCFCTNLFHFFP